MVPGVLDIIASCLVRANNAVPFVVVGVGVIVVLNREIVGIGVVVATLASNLAMVQEARFSLRKARTTSHSNKTTPQESKTIRTR